MKLILFVIAVGLVCGYLLPVDLYHPEPTRQSGPVMVSERPCYGFELCFANGGER